MKKTLRLLILIILFCFSVFSQSTTETDKNDPVRSAAKKAAQMIKDAAVENEQEQKNSPGGRNESKTGNLPVELSLEIFNMIEPDMSYEMVRDLIGAEGTKKSGSKSRGYESFSYNWKGEKFARISAGFRNGKLVSKSQRGITPKQGTAPVDQAKFKQIKKGMNYYEVLAIIGVEGEMTRLTRSSNSTITSYIWKGPKFAQIITTFRNGQLSKKTQINLPQ